jgi:hypothetical protein
MILMLQFDVAVGNHLYQITITMSVWGQEWKRDVAMHSFRRF